VASQNPRLRPQLWQRLRTTFGATIGFTIGTPIRNHICRHDCVHKSGSDLNLHLKPRWGSTMVAPTWVHNGGPDLEPPVEPSSLEPPLDSRLDPQGSTVMDCYRGSNCGSNCCRPCGRAAGTEGPTMHGMEILRGELSGGMYCMGQCKIHSTGLH